MRRSSGPLVEPLVVRVERGDRDIDEFHFSDRAVAATGLDQHRRTGPYRMAEHLVYDDIIGPSELRDRILDGLSTLEKR